MNDLPSWSLHDFKEDSPFISCALLLRRNIDPYFFPCRLPEKEKKECAALIKSALNMKEYCSLPSQQSNYLSSLFQLPPSFDLITHQKDPYLISFHANDHLSLCTLHPSSIKTAYEQASRIMKSLSSLKFSFNKRFGYLTANPYYCGTGLTITTTLHIPALLHTQKLFDEIETFNSNLSLSGWFQKNVYEGDLVSFQNQYSLGLYEEDIVRTLQTATDHLIAKEQEIMNELTSKMSPKLFNTIAKGLGILQHCKAINKEEALHHLSLLEIGLKTKVLSSNASSSRPTMQKVLSLSQEEEIASCVNQFTKEISENNS